MSGLKKANHLILAEGEVTGHRHACSTGVLYEDEQCRPAVLDITDGAVISHEEHGPINLTGLFDIRITQEFDHAAEAARDVAD